MGFFSPLFHPLLDSSPSLFTHSLLLAPVFISLLFLLFFLFSILFLHLPIWSPPSSGFFYETYLKWDTFLWTTKVRVTRVIWSQVCWFSLSFHVCFLPRWKLMCAKINDRQRLGFGENGFVFLYFSSSISFVPPPPHASPPSMFSVVDSNEDSFNYKKHDLHSLLIVLLKLTPDVNSISWAQFLLYCMGQLSWGQ